MKTVAIVLAAGSGKRMGTKVKKQYLALNDKPVLYYALKAFEDSFIDEIILVTSSDDIPYVQENVVDKFHFSKIKKIVEGGKERYNSVYNGIMAIDRCDVESDSTYIFIHDGARPMINQDILARGLKAVVEYDACVIGMPSKDTVKIASEDGFVSETPNRSLVWNIQTPQIFKLNLISEAYEYVVGHEEEFKAQGVNITDDAMVLEAYSHHPVKLVEGSYENIKVTTPEDMRILESLISAG